MKTTLKLALCVALATSSTACLKTRAQLRNEGSHEQDIESKPIPAQVQEVQPQGSYVIDELKGEITRLTGRIEDLERQNQQNQAANAGATNAKTEDLKKLEAKVAELEQRQAALQEALAKAQAAPPADPSELYMKGRSQLQAGELDGAIESFSAYLRAPNIRNAEEATFLRAEAYYETKQYKKAIVDYSKFPEKFTRSKHMPMALYKIGLSFEGMGMKEDARGFYQELLDKFPKSAEAKKAKAKLK